jgi:hypothetical protein
MKKSLYAVVIGLFHEDGLHVPRGSCAGNTLANIVSRLYPLINVLGFCC